jgi:hypothetical protein
MDYLTSPPSPLNDYSQSTIRDLLQALEPFQLEEAELLMILNLRPASVPELDVVVEEAQDRFGEDKMIEIVDIIERVLGKSAGLDVDMGDGNDTEQSSQTI